MKKEIVNLIEFTVLLCDTISSMTPLVLSTFIILLLFLYILTKEKKWKIISNKLWTQRKSWNEK